MDAGAAGVVAEGGTAPDCAGVGGVTGTGWLRIASDVGVAGVAALTLVLTAPGAAGTLVWVVLSEPGRTTGLVSESDGFLLSAKDLYLKSSVSIHLLAIAVQWGPLTVTAYPLPDCAPSH